MYVASGFWVECPFLQKSAFETDIRGATGIHFKARYDTHQLGAYQAGNLGASISSSSSSSSSSSNNNNNSNLMITIIITIVIE